MVKNCDQCQKPFEPKRSDARFCSKLCGNKHCRQKTIARGMCGNCCQKPLKSKSYCAECLEHMRFYHVNYYNSKSGKESRREQLRRYRASKEGKTVIRINRTKWLYNLTPEDEVQLHKNQNGLCAISKYPISLNPEDANYRDIDHDHKTGKVRGLVLNRYNRGIGMFHDDPILLRQAADYLERAA